ncbi:hypothetical protein ANCCAN_06122 [Ancylostoma caninum]|uniref:Uncharacterized protein n=1 Tax=Ancylostoma caninum TaxID=29170 RepID=A0A368GXP0_ANCCA|nr:hypothetical protein ANCCAN_06122 [Ancylostoma caninum]
MTSSLSSTLKRPATAADWSTTRPLRRAISLENIIFTQMPNEQNGYCGPHTSSSSISSNRNADTNADGSLRYQRRPGEHLMRGPAYAGPIPRVRTKQLNQGNDVDQYEDYSPTVIDILIACNIDFPIYDEFRFLDEPDTPSPASSAHPIVNAHATPAEPMNCKRRLTPSLIAYCLLPLIQLTISIGLILLAVLRLRELFQDRLLSNSLVDFERPDGPLPLDEQNESSRTLKIRSAISVLIPAAFQCVAAIAGFWPLTRENRRYYQCIHITFCSLAVLQWLPSVHAVAIELNQTFVQMHEWYQMCVRFRVIDLSIGFKISRRCPSSAELDNFFS